MTGRRALLAVLVLVVLCPGLSVVAQETDSEHRADRNQQASRRDLLCGRGPDEAGETTERHGGVVVCDLHLKVDLASLKEIGTPRHEQPWSGRLREVSEREVIGNASTNCTVRPILPAGT